MAQTFRPLVCCLICSSLVFVAPGCRTTTSKLASVPGLGWMERDDQGWAGYEPAPSLPRPSANSEPSATGAPAASSIAENSGVNPNATTYGRATGGEMVSSYPKDTGRFDSRYLPQGSTTAPSKKNNASGYGDYASAYGKYGPPKSLTPTEGSVKPQQGPYNVASAPNYTTTPSTTTTQGYSSYGQDRLASGPSATDRGSRFEATVPASTSSTPGPTSPTTTGLAENPSPAKETYTPPGFIKKPDVNPVNSRFDSMANRGSTFGNRTPAYVASAGSPGATRPAAPSSANDRFGTSTTPVATPAGDVAPSRFGGTPVATTPESGSRFGGAPSGVGTQLGNLGRNAASSISQSARNAAGEMKQSASDFGSHVGQVTRDATQNAVDMAGQTANGYLDTIRSKSAGTPGFSPGAARRAVEGVAPATTHSYPVTDTPHGYLDAITPPSGGSTPATAPSIQRSSTPFRPGSTSTFRSSMRTTKKHQVSLASAVSSPEDQLVLAVGDKFQFPRNLR